MDLRLPFWRSVRAKPAKLRRRYADSIPALRQVSDDLVRLGHVTEQDFLLVGDQLQRVLAEAEQISAQCAELVGFLSGDEAGRGAQQLGSILDRARVMAEQAEGNRRALDEMLSGVSRISGPLAGLNSRMRTFRVMATLIRIEGARLRQAGVDFETLADDVRKLAADIEQNSTTVLSGSLELREIVREAAAGVGEFESRQKTELPRIQEQAADSLASLRARRDSASRASGRLGGRYDAVRRDIGELVVSLQLHDITRQQIEHAATALREAEQDLAAGGKMLGPICELERAQLQQSRQSFLAAVRRVKESLAGIARQVSEMAAESTEVLEGAGQEDSFLGEMSHGFASIRAAMAEYAEARYALSSVAGTVAEGVQNMAGFVSTIEEIGTRMQRIALNANIKAIRIGEAGIPLGAVADCIQRLAADSTAQTEIAAEGIRSVTHGSNLLVAELGESGVDLVSDLEQVMATFHTADAETRRRLGQIGGSGRSLSEQLHKLQEAIQADRVLSETIDSSCAQLERIAAEAEWLSPAPGKAEHAAIMRQIEERYTMHAERAVHRREMKDEAPAVITAELGDNVELF